MTEKTFLKISIFLNIWFAIILILRLDEPRRLYSTNFTDWWIFRAYISPKEITIAQPKIPLYSNSIPEISAEPLNNVYKPKNLIYETDRVGIRPNAFTPMLERQKRILGLFSQLNSQVQFPHLTNINPSNRSKFLILNTIMGRNKVRGGRSSLFNDVSDTKFQRYSRINKLIGKTLIRQITERIQTHHDQNNLTSNEAKRLHEECTEVYRPPEMAYPYFTEGFSFSPECQVKLARFLRGISIVYLIKENKSSSGLYTKFENIDSILTEPIKSPTLKYYYNSAKTILQAKRLHTQSFTFDANKHDFKANFTLKKSSPWHIKVYIFHQPMLARHRFSRAHKDKELTVKGGGYGDDIWEMIASNIQTPYVLMGTELIRPSPNITRLLYEVRYGNQDWDVLGGSIVTRITRRWSLDCYQMRVYDYTLFITAGYYQSARECLYCDYFDGPLLLKTRVLKEIGMNHRSGQSNDNRNSTTGSAFMEDLYMRLKFANNQKYKVGVCPDVQFSVSKSIHTHLEFNVNEEFKTPLELGDYNDLKFKWDIDQIVFKTQFRNSHHTQISPRRNNHSDNNSTKITLPESFNNNKGICARLDRSRLMPPYCRIIFHDMLAFVISQCQAHQIECALQEGTLLGAVKLGQVLPWDRDGDVAFLSAHFFKLARLHGEFRAAGYDLLVSANPWCCLEEIIAGGKFIVQTQGMHIELYGQHKWQKVTNPIISTKTMNNGSTNTDNSASHSSKTYIRVRDVWMPGPENPGLHIRNRYGPNCYKHAPHWMDAQMQSGWERYDNRRFEPCIDDHHACLDKIPRDGNIDITVD